MIPFLFLASIAYNATLDMNHCQTVGATYHYSFVEQPNGRCGALPDYTLKVDQTPSSMRCQKIVSDGCYYEFDYCSNGGTTISGNTSFIKDGSFGVGVETISMRGRCVSTYTIKMDRK